MKENDLFLNILDNPEFSLSDFQTIGFTADNTGMESEDYYKNNFNDPEQYLQTGFEKLNLRKGDLIILASRPCIGRFSFAMSIVNTKRNPQALPVVRQCVLHGQ